MLLLWKYTLFAPSSAPEGQKEQVKFLMWGTIHAAGCEAPPPYLIGRWSWGAPHMAGPPTGGALLRPRLRTGWRYGEGRCFAAIWWISWNHQTSRTKCLALCICQVDLFYRRYLSILKYLRFIFMIVVMFTAHILFKLLRLVNVKCQKQSELDPKYYLFCPNNSQKTQISSKWMETQLIFTLENVINNC